MAQPRILRREGAILLVVDIQEKLLAKIYHKEDLIVNISKLLTVANKLKLPFIVTEQYPKGLGQTVPEITALLPDYEPYEKLSFSSCEAQEVIGALEKNGAKKVIVIGIEAHVCVLQTVLDLLSLGYEVYVPNDGVSSRRKNDLMVAIKRMMDEGAVITTVETAIFELLRKAGTQEFKEVLEVIK